MSLPAPRPLFNPNPRIQTVTLSDEQCCYVVDDALSDPQAMVDWAGQYHGAFRPVDFNAYPGQYLLLTEAMNRAVESFFMQHVRPLFDARRLQRMHARLAMVTLPPQALRPAQWLCHSDHFGLGPSQSIQASVLYLFHDERFGGTGFYAPTRPPNQMAQLFGDATRMTAEDFHLRYGIEPGYIQRSGPYFERTGGVLARWNRMLFYDGTILHSGDILSPGMLSDDPLKGRLTLNGFFTCRRHAV